MNSAGVARNYNHDVLRLQSALAMIRAFIPLLGLVAVTFIWMACGNSSRSPGTACNNDAACEAGVCFEGACRTVCSDNAHCENDAVCTNGLCFSLTELRCETATDCIHPGPCQTSAGASCQQETCVYPDDPCTTPPADECSTDDKTLLVYAAKGPCEPGVGRCEYEAAELPCETCSNNECLECLVAAHCSDPPAHPNCFVASCVDNECSYALQVPAVCEPQFCKDGIVIAERNCTEAGGCPDGTAFASACPSGFGCNDEATDCVTSCTKHSECAPGFYCDEQACHPAFADGQFCSVGAQCVSGHCNNNHCCQEGDCCNTEADCPASYSQDSICHDTSNSTDCQGTRTDAVCEDHVCISVEIEDDSGCAGHAHTCPNNLASIVCTTDHEQEPPVCSNECSGSAPCRDGYWCDGGTCLEKRPLGDSCPNGNEQCISGNCANGRCCNEACNRECETCNTDGICVALNDDNRCGTIECSTLSHTCRTYHNLTSNRCKQRGQCKSVNTTDCTSFTNTSAGTSCANSGCKRCNGSGSCTQDAPLNTACGTCRKCNSTGTCIANTGDACGDCGTCSSGSCVGDDAKCAGSCNTCSSNGSSCSGGCGVADECCGSTCVPMGACSGN